MIAEKKKAADLFATLNKEASTSGKAVIILPHTTLHPLAKIIKQDGNKENESIQDFYSLMHPEAIVNMGCRRLFADVEEGEHVQLMVASEKDLVDLVVDVTHDVAKDFTER